MVSVRLDLEITAISVMLMPSRGGYLTNEAEH
jgi:hypothetical protein